MTIDLNKENERQKVLGTRLGLDMDYIPGYDDGAEPESINHLEEYDKANDR